MVMEEYYSGRFDEVAPPANEYVYFHVHITHIHAMQI